MRTAHGSNLLWLACACCCLACGGEPEVADFAGFDDETLLTSDHFRLHLHQSDPDACPAAVDELERHLRVLTEYLGVPAPARAIDYYRFASVDELQASHACNNALDQACLHGSRVASWRLLDAHELIHAYVQGSRPPWVFIEGLADSLSCGYGPSSRPHDEANLEDLRALPWQDLLGWHPTGEHGDVTYYRAGTQLVRYLVDRAGTAKLMDYYGSARGDGTANEANTYFESIFGESLADAWQAALALDLPNGPCLTPFECQSEPLTVDGSWSETPTCGVHYRYRTLELAAPTSLLFEGTGATDRHGERDSLDLLFSCDGLEPSPTWSSYSPVPIATRLAPGKYALVMPISNENAQITANARGIATSCTEALGSALPLDASATDTLLFVPQSGDTWFTAIDPGDIPQARVFASQSPTAQLCNGCDANATCRTVATEIQSFDLDPAPAILQTPTLEQAGAFAAFTFQPK